MFVYFRVFQQNKYNETIINKKHVPDFPCLNFPLQPLRYIEMFAGQANVWRQVDHEGYEALAMDITYATQYEHHLRNAKTNPFDILSTSGLG